jgi:sensor histidine kinase YesM
LGDRLRVETDVSPGALDVPVPFLTLQPLVENAILHGIDPVPQGGTLRIRAALVGESLEIMVADDGVGATEQPSRARNGIGLGALRERLALTYDRFSIAGENGEQRGYVVRLSLPAA